MIKGFIPKLFSFKSTKDLIRVGKDNDGGYLCGTKTIKLTNTLISFGIGEDWSFEKEFLKFNNKSRLYCYDNTLNKTLLLQRFI